jgi:hypothetical protein
VKAWPGFDPLPVEFDKSVRAAVGEGRLGMDAGYPFEINRRIDDVGFFDSIMLASTYRGLVELDPTAMKLDRQSLEAWQLDGRALRACGVRLLVTDHEWSGAKPIAVWRPLRFYELRDAAARVELFHADRVQYSPPSEIGRAMRDPGFDPVHTLLLPDSARTARASRGTLEDRAIEGTTSEAATSDAIAQSNARGTIAYERVNSDRFEISVASPTSGWVRVLESCDEGWHATLDGEAVPIFPAHTMAMAVPVPAGAHELALEFSTPGRNLGLAISAVGTTLLILAIFLLWRRRASVGDASASPRRSAA